MRAELRRWRLRRQRVYDLTVRVLRVAGGDGRVFDEVVDVWASLLLGRVGVAEAEKRLEVLLRSVRQ